MTRRTMRAYRLLEWGRAEFAETNVPEPGAGELLIRVGGAGLCRTDLDLMSAPAGHFAFAPPFTLGHETAGWIEQAGSGTTLPEGSAVVVSCVHSCGQCEFCLRGIDNHCWAAVKLITRGMGLDGGLAEYVVVPEREVVALGGLEPRHAAPLADAGVTSYHAITRSRAALARGSVAVVYGGLGDCGLKRPANGVSTSSYWRAETYSSSSGIAAFHREPCRCTPTWPSHGRPFLISDQE